MSQWILIKKIHCWVQGANVHVFTFLLMTKFIVEFTSICTSTKESISWNERSSTFSVYFCNANLYIFVVFLHLVPFMFPYFYYFVTQIFNLRGYLFSLFVELKHCFPFFRMFRLGLETFGTTMPMTPMELVYCFRRVMISINTIFTSYLIFSTIACMP